MSIITTVRLLDPFGVPLTEIASYASLDYTLNCTPGGIGVLELALPLSFNTALLLPDARLGVYRSINGRPPYLDNGAIYLLRTVDKGPEDTKVRAYHATSLLDRRVIAYSAGSSYCTKAAAPADDLIKAFVNENMLSGIVGVDRDGVEIYADVSAYLTMQASVGLGASVAKSAARRRLIDVCIDLANASITAGTYLTFEIYAPTEGTLELRTYTGQRGVDRRGSVVLSALRGNLINAHLLTDANDSASFIIAGGQGEETARLIGTAMDVARAAASPFGRIERFRDASNVSTQAAIDDEADAQLRAARPTILFTGELTETPGLTRGIDYDLGDIVTAEDRDGMQYDVRIDGIHEGQKASCLLRSVT